jgi:hypothetical protein
MTSSTVWSVFLELTLTYLEEIDLRVYIRDLNYVRSPGLCTKPGRWLHLTRKSCMRGKGSAASVRTASRFLIYGDSCEA